MASEQMDIYGGAAPVVAPPVAPVVPYNKPRWERLYAPGQPVCGHCQMVRQSEVQRAAWRRTGVTGSVLFLCRGHADWQREHDNIDKTASMSVTVRPAIAQCHGETYEVPVPGNNGYHR